MEQGFFAAARKEALACTLLQKSTSLHLFPQSTSPDTGTARKWIEGDCWVAPLANSQAGGESGLLSQLHKGQALPVVLSQGSNEIHDKEAFWRKLFAMGQESGKAAWPRPAGGYQTLTGRRYGRRHAYVSFRPSIAKPWKHLKESEHQWEGMELNTVSKDNGLSASGILSTNELLSQCTGYDQTMDPKKDVDFEPQKENRFLSSPLNRGLFQCESNEFVLPSATEPLGSYLDSQNTESPKWSIPGDFFETASRNQGGIGLVNMDSYEPESSEGEDEDSATHSSLQKEGKLQKRLDTMLSELEKGVDYLNGLQSYLSAVIHDGSNQQIEPPCSVAMDNLPNMDIAVKGHQSELKEHLKPLPTLGNVEEINGYVKMEEIKEKRERNLDKSSLGVQAGGNLFCCMTEQPSSSEMVVRPKVRKERTDTHSIRDLHSPDDLYGHCTKEMKGNIECCGSNFALWNCMDKIHKDSRSGSNVKETTGIHKEQATNQQENLDDTITDNSFWDDFENDCNIGEESSSLSSGEEWSAIWTSDFVLEKMHSSDESWETLSGVDEQPTEPNSISSSLDEEAFNHYFTVGEPASLEEGEIPWVAFNEESDSTSSSSSSSSTDETEGLGQLGHSGLLILNDSNNFEDDSSISEDLDMEWRLLDELGEGLAAQAISSVDPQLLTFMALEERLAQAMEAALAHLESLAIDGEQAPPPAPKETIECLPQVPITEEHNGLEQSCAICCSEYVKEDLVTELPCHHLFHRPCVTLWLQKSGTCPVCRHILASTLPEAAAATATFLSEPGTPPPTRDGPTIR
ncbi:E3 ubiquitin-protein ligase Praja-2 isoform X3 [Pristis pectinata]|uniref:E3 ubiquitin-protein ligase Praja-2 isoform X3 n=1 Tax=Pristis pectinata TaxID=685728 RepID=UPI00223D71EB|nr:E3 ubiquitin-protein ligase Praja-2 isoform X3 [Pristis pectinata]